MCLILLYSRLLAAEKRRKRQKLRQAKAARKIFRIWRLYRVIKFRKAMFNFIKYREFHEKLYQLRETEDFHRRIQIRAEREEVEIESYRQRRIRPVEAAGESLLSSPRKTADMFGDTASDSVSQWMKNKFSARRNDG